MYNKGFIRIVEATIAILLILTVMFIFFNESRVSTAPDLSERGRDILEELSNDPDMRNEVLTLDSIAVKTYIDSLIPEEYLDYQVIICGVDDACGLDCTVLNICEKEIYTAERVISYSYNIELSTPKKIRLFIYEK